jgi:hypothetical protein
MRPLGSWALILLAAAACSSESPETLPVSPAVPVPTASSSASSTAKGSCGAQVVIAFYADSRCQPGTEVGQRRYDTAQACFSWRAAGSAAQENSATRFQCYRDRLCYTQHADSLVCGGARAVTDKESRTDRCTKEPNGALYSKILNGTEACPEAPAGFACPASAGGLGTPGVLACPAP